MTRLILVGVDGSFACLLSYFQKAVMLLLRDQYIITVNHYSILSNLTNKTKSKRKENNSNKTNQPKNLQQNK